MRVKISGPDETCRVYATDFLLDKPTRVELEKKLRAIDGVSYVVIDWYSVAVFLKSPAYVWAKIQKEVLSAMKELYGGFVVEIDFDVRAVDVARSVSVLVNKLFS